LRGCVKSVSHRVKARPEINIKPQFHLFPFCGLTRASRGTLRDAGIACAPQAKR
jgi:hypothetical protein